VEIGQDLPPRKGDLQSLRRSPIGHAVPTQHISNSVPSLQVKAEKRFTRRLAFIASFVWAKSIDDATTLFRPVRSFGAQTNVPEIGRGLSFFDVASQTAAADMFIHSGAAGVAAFLGTGSSAPIYFSGPVLL